MKKIILSLIAAFSFLTACQDSSHITTEEISPNKMYLFYSNSCPHCHSALDYINQNHPDAKITMVNIANRQGYDLFLKCAQKFNLGKRIGTPLFCLGDNYMMGWSSENAKVFDNMVHQFNK